MEIRDPFTHKIIGLAMEVHRELGPGLLESAYEACLAHELRAVGIEHQRQQALPVYYKGITIDCAYRIDILVPEKLVIELKTVEALAPIHDAQLLTYLKLSQVDVGLLINFNVPVLRDGIKRLIWTKGR